MARTILILIFSLLLFAAGAYAAGSRGMHAPKEPGTQTATVAPPAGAGYYLDAAPPQQHSGSSKRAIIILFLQSIIVGILAVFTPYVYTIHPFTIGYLTRDAPTPFEKKLNLIIYAGAILFVFAILGVVISLLVKLTGLTRYTEHWIYNFFCCRFFITLSFAFLGGFNIKLPAFIVNATANKAKTNTIKGIFYMALTLPFASASSTVPILAVVLVLSTSAGVIGPVIGLCGVGIGLGLPFAFPAILNFFVKSKTLLNNIQVIMGFLALMLALKFLSKADISLGWNLLDRDIFIAIWMGLLAFMGIYMLGFVNLSKDIEPEQNLYGQEYITLTRLFIAIAAFTFALYLLPGMWGAPLKGVSGFLPGV